VPDPARHCTIWQSGRLVWTLDPQPQSQQGSARYSRGGYASKASRGTALALIEHQGPEMNLSMRRIEMKNILSRMAIGCTAALLAQSAVAGGFTEIDDAEFGANSNEITNAWWPLPGGTRFTYFAEGEDGCAVVLTDVLHESTLDWYAQDTDGNVWYFGEDTVSLDFETCDRPDGMGGCKDGSWEAGLDVAGVGSIAEEGILMLADPTGNKGVFYFQEFYEGEAKDMGKILNFKKVETPLYGEVAGCAMIKEWSPLVPGAIEHKYYCENLGLVLVEENSGGKTVFEELIDVSPAP
jgi:hypothetical protein